MRNSLSQWILNRKVLLVSMLGTAILLLYGFQLTSNFSSSAASPESTGYIYQVRGDDLWRATLNGARVGTLRRINTGGWEDRQVAVSRGHIYQVRGDDLYGATFSDGSTFGTFEIINTGGWERHRILASGGYLYQLRGNDLYGGRISGLTLSNFRERNTGGWKWETAISGGYIYQVRGDDLWGAPVSSGFQLSESFKIINGGGWRGSNILVSGGWLYQCRNGELFGGPINALSLTNFSKLSASGWNGQIFAPTE